MIDLLHHLGVVVPDADDALGFYRDVMGLTVAKDEVVEEQGVRGVLLPIGENEIELLQPVRDDTGVARFLEGRGPTLHHLCFRTNDVRAELARIRGLGVELIDEEPRYGLAGEIAFLHPKSMRGVLIELAEVTDRHASPDKGFDHISIRVGDYEAAQQLWRDVIGIEEGMRFELEEAQSIIGQLAVGQCMIELIAPDGPDAPLSRVVADEGERALSTFALEVFDLDAEITRYRAAGIELPDPEPGHFPRSRRTTISEEQAFGVSIQLIQYARSGS